MSIKRNIGMSIKRKKREREREKKKKGKRKKKEDIAKNKVMLIIGALINETLRPLPNYVTQQRGESISSTLFDKTTLCRKILRGKQAKREREREG